MILSCSNITKAFGTDTILKNISFHIEEQEKAAIVGINGAGKSTLLKIIVGDLPADSGDVVLAKGRTIGYLAQHQDLESDRTIYEEVLEIKRPIIQMEERIRQLEQEMEGREGAALEAMLAEYSRLTHRFEMENGYAYKSEVTGVLKGLGFCEDEFTKKVSPYPADRRPASPWASSCSPTRTSSFWTSLPTTWIWAPSPGWRITY